MAEGKGKSCTVKCIHKIDCYCCFQSSNEDSDEGKTLGPIPNENTSLPNSNKGKNNSGSDLEKKSDKESEPLTVKKAVMEIPRKCAECAGMICTFVSGTKGVKRVSLTEKYLTVTGAIDMANMAELISKAFGFKVKIISEEEEERVSGGSDNTMPPPSNDEIPKPQRLRDYGSYSMPLTETFSDENANACSII